jgi:hypothetical protein
LNKPGGISRDEAVKTASENVESLREHFVAAIPGEIIALETFVAGKTSVSAELLEAMLTRAGQLLTLSGTYGFDLLDTVVKRFCDLALGMVEKNLTQIAPVTVHLQAMRLVCPGAPDISEAEIDHVLAGLIRVHAHYGISSVSQDVDAQAV